MQYNILKKDVRMCLGLLVFLSGGIILAKPASSGEDSVAEPAPIEISEELISDLEVDDITEAAPNSEPDSSINNVSPWKDVEDAPESKKEPQAESQEEAEDFFKPLREGEVELPLISKAAAPILPEELLARKMPEFHHQIQRSYEPGCTLESTHFLVEADPYWKDRAPQLMKIVQLAEETRVESELVASLWRKPLFTSSNPRNLNASMVPSWELKSGKGILKPEFSGDRIRLRVVSPGNSSFPAGSCHFAQTEDGVVLTITAENVQELDRQGLRRSLRRETFCSTLRDGQEDRIFPQWLQNGLADVFAGQETVPSRRDGNLLFCLSRLDREPEDAQGRTAVSLVRYCLTSNDGKAFFPFWDQLAKMYFNGRQSLSELGGNRLLSALEEKVRENQMNSQEILGRFFNEIESNPRNESFASWQNSLTSVSGGNPVRVFWFPEAQIVNGKTQEPPLPRLDLDESWKTVFLEMAQVLKFTSFSPEGQNLQDFRTGSEGVGSGIQTHGVKIQEFGENQTQKFLSSGQESRKEDFQAVPETASGIQTHGVKIQEFGDNRTGEYLPSGQESQSGNSQAVTAEDMQKLESVLGWLVKNPQGAVSLNADGSIFSEYFIPGQLDKMFHPQDRTYLLQEYQGNLVLSATFQDDYVLHVIMEKSPQASGVPEIRILGIEKPEKAGNQE